MSVVGRYRRLLPTMFEVISCDAGGAHHSRIVKRPNATAAEIHLEYTVLSQRTLDLTPSRELHRKPNREHSSLSQCNKHRAQEISRLSERHC